MPFDPSGPVHRRTAHNRRPDVAQAIGGRLTWHGAVDLFRHSRTWAESSRKNMRDNLCNSRLLTYLTETRGRGLFLDEITADDLQAYLTWYRQDQGGAYETTVKIRGQFRQLARWARDNQGYAELDRPPLTTASVPALREDSPPSKDDEQEEPALTHVEIQTLLEAAGASARTVPPRTRPDGTLRRPTRNGPLAQPRLRQRKEEQDWMAARDRLIVELLCFTGIRPSELVNLSTRRVFLDTRPPRIEIRGAVHHRSRRSRGSVKTVAAQRDVPLTMSRSTTLVADMGRWLTTVRPRNAAGETVFCTTTRDAEGRFQPLTLEALKGILERLQRITGIHCNAYRFRHTCATWLAGAGLPQQYLMYVMGWEDPAMVTRYFRGRQNPAILEAAEGILA
jgi:integrase